MSVYASACHNEKIWEYGGGRVSHRWTEACVHTSMCLHALDCAPAHLSLSLVNAAFMGGILFWLVVSGSGTFGMWLSASFKCKVKDFSLFVKKKNKD